MFRTRTAKQVLASILVGVVPAALGIVVVVSAPVHAAERSWLQEINYYRAAAGVPLVVDDPSRDAGIKAHETYLAKTPAKYLTGKYASAHTENPASPYYTAAGAEEAGASDLGGGGSDLDAIDGWWTAPFHAIGMLRRDLRTVSFYRDPTSGAAGLDVISGLDYSQDVPPGPVVFPGPGATTDLPAFGGGESPSPLETCGWQTAGLPIIAMLPTAPDQAVTAALTLPNGATISSGTSKLCIVDENNYTSSDPVYGDAGRSILQFDHAVLIIPAKPLVNGSYAIALHQPGADPSAGGAAATDIAWTFSVDVPKPKPIPPLSQALQITTVRWNSPGPDNHTAKSRNGEYVKVTNRSGTTRSLTGYVLSERHGRLYRFGAIKLGPHKSLTLYSGPGKDKGSALHWNSKTYVWDNSNDEAVLLDAYGRLVSYAAWGAPGKGVGTFN